MVDRLKVPLAGADSEPMSGALWDRMNKQPRVAIPDLTRDDVPLDPGVYAFYRGDKARYVGKAASLQGRVWKAHCGKSRGMRNSAFRRNVAEHLGIAKANDIYKAEHRPSEAEATQVRAWIEECEVAWITRATEPGAVALETALKSEWKPELTKV